MNQWIVRPTNGAVRMGVQAIARSLFGTFAIALLVSCADSKISNAGAQSTQPIVIADQRNDVMHRLQIAEAKWAAAKIQDYAYELARECMLCESPLNVIVRSGKCESISAIGVRTMSTCDGVTIPERMAYIRSWANDKSGSTIRVVFDEKYGFPTEWFIQTNNPNEGETARIQGFVVN